MQRPLLIYAIAQTMTPTLMNSYHTLIQITNIVRTYPEIVGWNLLKPIRCRRFVSLSPKLPCGAFRFSYRNPIQVSHPTLRSVVRRTERDSCTQFRGCQQVCSSWTAPQAASYSNRSTGTYLQAKVERRPWISLTSVMIFPYSMRMICFSQCYVYFQQSSPPTSLGALGFYSRHTPLD